MAIFYLMVAGVIFAIWALLLRSLPAYVPGLPRVGQRLKALHKIIFRQGDWFSDLAAGKVIQGALSRDPSNTPDVTVLTPGLIMGKITSAVAEAAGTSVPGLYAPSFIGPLTVAAAGSATSLTVSVATATEIVRRIGTSGTLTLTGPPAANGTNAVQTVTFSAVNTATGVITCTALGAAAVIGSLVGPTDGSQVPVTFISDGYGVPVTDTDQVTNLNAPFAYFPIAGVIISANLVFWPSDTSIQAYIRNNLSTAWGGKFVFDDVL